MRGEMSPEFQACWLITDDVQEEHRSFFSTILYPDPFLPIVAAVGVAWWSDWSRKFIKELFPLLLHRLVFSECSRRVRMMVKNNKSFRRPRVGWNPLKIQRRGDWWEGWEKDTRFEREKWIMMVTFWLTMPKFSYFFFPNLHHDPEHGLRELWSNSTRIVAPLYHYDDNDQQSEDRRHLRSRNYLDVHIVENYFVVHGLLSRCRNTSQTSMSSVIRFIIIMSLRWSQTTRQDQDHLRRI